MNTDKKIWTAVGLAAGAVLLACGNPTGATWPTTTATVPTTVVEVTTPEGVAETVSQKNAARRAASYLNTGSFSYSGLIKQLQFEGFSSEDAAYGATSTNADWMAQAVAKGKSYMKSTGFSRKGLIDQLKFEGFTQAEAEHGATQNGL